MTWNFFDRPDVAVVGVDRASLSTLQSGLLDGIKEFLETGLPTLAPNEDPPPIVGAINRLGETTIVVAEDMPLAGGLHNQPLAQEMIARIAVMSGAIVLAFASAAWMVAQPLDQPTPEHLDHDRYRGRMDEHPKRTEVMQIAICDPRSDTPVFNAVTEIQRKTDAAPTFGPMAILGMGEGAVARVLVESLILARARA